MTLDNNGISLNPNGAATNPLEDGEYVLTIRDLATDAAGNKLDGDRDGLLGTSGASTGYAGYAFHFNVGSDRVVGPEIRGEHERRGER